MTGIASRLNKLEAVTNQGEVKTIIAIGLEGDYKFDGQPCQTRAELQRLMDDWQAANPKGKIILFVYEDTPIPPTN